MQERIRQATSTCISRQIVQAASRLHREIGFKKTTVADIARGASMSPANVYRFFPSKQAIEEAVVADLFEHVSAAATFAARGGPALEGLTAALRAISQLHEHRLKTERKQHELVAAAVGENWAVALSHADRIRGLVSEIIAAGQASGELRPGSSVAMTCCLLEAMDGYLNPSRINAATIRPTFDEMMDFCASAMRSSPSSSPITSLCEERTARIGAATPLQLVRNVSPAHGDELVYAPTAPDVLGELLSPRHRTDLL